MRIGFPLRVTLGHPRDIQPVAELQTPFGGCLQTLILSRLAPLCSERESLLPHSAADYRRFQRSPATLPRQILCRPPHNRTGEPIRFGAR